MNELISRGWLLFADEHAVSPGIDATRMSEYGSAVRVGIRDVVGRRTAGRIEANEGANALRDFVIGARGITAHAEASDDRGILIDILGSAAAFSAERKRPFFAVFIGASPDLPLLYRARQ